MKILKTTVLTLFLGLSMIAIQAQVTKPNLKKPKLKPRIATTKPLQVLTPFEEIMYNLDHGICYNIALVSLQLNPKNYKHTSFDLKTRHGSGFIERNGSALKGSIPLQIGIPTRLQRTIETTIEINKNGKDARISIRNSSYHYYFAYAKIVKKKNGYFITVEQNENTETVSFTIAIYRTSCLI